MFLFVVHTKLVHAAITILIGAPVFEKIGIKSNVRHPCSSDGHVTSI